MFLQSARQILGQAAQASQLARRAARGEVGGLSLGFVCLATSSILTRLVREFRVKYPGIELTLREMSPVTQMKALAGGDIQLGYTRRFDDPAGAFNFLEIFHDRYLVAPCPMVHPLAARRRVSLAQPGRRGLHRLQARRHAGLLQSGLRRVPQAGFSPRIVSEPDLLQTILILVDAAWASPSCRAASPT